ncbi:Mbeg1-like protein [Dyella acidiphila]|uniref:DUF2974 domain-containing protein n=1 Tax=Dyella acidiphila TaxID=2775866 RepID=A0ABR9GBP2_9GAMM|nr:Mbeg1-like protein [Dyella acidiphila]MBE1161434.1 DUF2974 domain-containing protein [Dyella acidiphila]
MFLDASISRRQFTDTAIAPAEDEASSSAAVASADQHSSTPQLAYNAQAVQLASFQTKQAPGFAQQVEGQDAKPIDLDLAKLAQDSYNLDNKNIDGWTRLSDAQLEAADIDPASLNDTSTGFRAALYQDGKGDYVLAFKGTSGAQDWKADATQALGLNTAQYDEATALATKAKAAFGDNLVLTGHSLGGGLASTASVITDTPAVTFNAAGVNDATLQRLAPEGNVAAMKQAASDGLVRRYAVQGDILTGEQQTGAARGLIPQALGHEIQLRDPNKPAWYLEAPGLNLITDTVSGVRDHLMNSVIDALQNDQPWNHNGNYLRDTSITSRIAGFYGNASNTAANAVGTVADKAGGAASSTFDAAGSALDHLGKPGHWAGNAMRTLGTVSDKTITVAGGLAQGGIEVAGHLQQGAVEFFGGAITTGVNATRKAADWVGSHAKDALPWNW